MPKSTKRFIISLTIIAAIIVFDQLVKFWAHSVLAHQPGGQMDFIPGILRLRYIRNSGAAFSLFSGATWILGIISAALAVVIIWFLWRGRKNGSRMYQISLAFIAGGALGNVIDRFRLGYVVDMLEFDFVQFAIFNVADSFVCVGAVLFAIYILMHNSDARKAQS